MATRFDPEGAGYDWETAKSIQQRDPSFGPDETGHWPSRDPRTGQILKGKAHPTFHKTEAAEAQLGLRVFKEKDGRYYSQPVAGPDQYLKARTSRGRRILRNPVESLSSEIGVTFPDPRDPRRYVNFPSIFQGKRLTEDQARENFIKFNGRDPETGDDFGAETFTTAEEAAAANERRSRQTLIPKGIR
jgi:hypothetical protein